MVPNAWPGRGQTEFVWVHENIPITIPSSVDGVKVSYKINVSVVNQPGVYKFTGRSTCTTRLEPGETEVPLAGEPMSTPCAKHVVVKAASNAATVNFMAVAIQFQVGESLELVSPLYKEVWIRITLT